jgi:hypothetical protein
MVKVMGAAVPDPVPMNAMFLRDDKFVEKITGTSLEHYHDFRSGLSLPTSHAGSPGKDQIP